MKRLFAPIFALLLCACHTDKVVLDNGLLRLTFDRSTANLVSMTDLKTGYEYLDSTVAPKTLWELVPMADVQHLSTNSNLTNKIY